MKIYIITHKEFPEKYCDNIYTPLLVGADKNRCSFAEYFDNVGENIAYKNSSFCELTGLYWIWKNSKEDIVGLCHYRRYFTKNRYFLSDFFRLSERQISKLFQMYDIVLPERNHHEYMEETVYDNYKRIHNIDDWERTREVINRIYPDYSADFEWFEKQRIGYCYNMFISKKYIIDEYSKWLFDILFEVEKNIELDDYDSYNKRIYGFLAERLLNVWIHHKDLKIKEVPVYVTEQKFMDRVWHKIGVK